MATFARPGVEVTQVVSSTSPAVTTPTLVPCIVGPCYQIVTPLDSTGQLDSSTKITLPAEIKSASALSDPLAISGHTMKLQVNGTEFTINFPVTIGGASISYDIVKSTINAAITGASADFIDDRLYIRTDAKGASATLKLTQKLQNALAVDSDILAINGDYDILKEGLDEYDNQEYVVPYTHFPSPKALVSEIVVKGADTKAYGYINGSLVEFSKTSAVNVNSYSFADTKWGNANASPTGATATYDVQPANTVGRATMAGKKLTGSSTNTLYHTGTEASIRIPLAYNTDLGTAASQEPHWPDTSGQAYLEVTSIGLSKYLTGGAVGNFVGSAGNALKVDFKWGATTDDVEAAFATNSLNITRSNETVSATALGGSTPTTLKLNGGVQADDYYNTWLVTLTGGVGAGQTRVVTDYDQGNNEITVATWETTPDNTTVYLLSRGNGATFAEFATALEAANVSGLDADKDVTISVVYPSAWASLPVLGNMNTAGAWNADTKLYYLGGGSDPVDFTNVPAGNERYAYVTGAVASAGTNAEAFQPSLVGEKLYFSLDGGEWEELTIASGDTLVTQINNMTNLAASAVTLTNDFGETASCIQVTSSAAYRASADAKIDHDSTIEIKADNHHVIEQLFEGYKTTTVPLTNFEGSATNQGRTAALAQSTDYNKTAAAELEKGLVPGSLTLAFTDVMLHGGVIIKASDNDISTQAMTATAPHALELDHDADGGFNSPAVLSITTLADTTVGLAAAIDTAIAADAGGVANRITCRAYGDYIILTNADTSGSFYIVGNATTDAKFVTLFGSDVVENKTATPTLNKTNVSGSVTWKDSGTDNAWQVTSFSPTTQLLVASDATDLDFTDTATLTALLVDDAGTDASNVQYNTGLFQLTYVGDLDATPANSEPWLASWQTTTDVSFTYTRGWACATSATSPLYTSRVFSAMSDATLPGDKVYDGNTLLGRVVSVGDFAPSATTYTGAQLVLSEYAVSAHTSITDWYIRAENLSSSDTRDIDAEASYDDTAKTFTIKHALLRDSAGVPATGSAAVYIDYKALRTDVTAGSSDPEMLVFNNTTEVESSIGPISTENPLAWGVYSAFLNASTISISALGVDETTADAPEGTLDSYERALDFLELKTLWSLVPLTQDREVHKLCDTHVSNMSLPANKKPRVVWVNQALPTEKESTLVVSGSCTLADIGGGKYELTFPVGTNVPTSLVGLKDANGNTLATGAGQTYDPADGLYMDLGSDGYKYHVSKTTSATVVEINTNDIYQPGSGPGTSGNDDAYYVTGTTAVTALGNFSATGESCSLFVRQAAISKSTTTGKLAIVTALGEIAGGTSGYVDKRVRFVQPEKIGMSENGLEVSVPGYYACCMLAGMRGQLSPSQPFTNYPITGITRPIGSSDLFSETHMATAAAGGVWWLVQDAPGGSVITRHQLTTDMTSLNTREDSVVAAIDYVEYSIRDQISRFIGRYNINKQLLEAVSLGLGGVLSGLEGSIVAQASLDEILQDTQNPDTILVTVSITPFYAANKISVTIIV